MCVKGTGFVEQSHWLDHSLSERQWAVTHVFFARGTRSTHSQLTFEIIVCAHHGITRTLWKLGFLESEQETYLLLWDDDITTTTTSIVQRVSRLHIDLPTERIKR
eukprot:scaffold27907_cov122-Amphora_coffeaeformis.AAC.1